MRIHFFPSLRSLCGVALIMTGMLTIAALLFYVPDDRSLLFDASFAESYGNRLGAIGAHLAGASLYIFGWVSILLAALCAWVGVLYVRQHAISKTTVAAWTLILVPLMVVNYHLHLVLFTREYPGGLVGVFLGRMVYACADAWVVTLALCLCITIGAYLVMAVTGYQRLRQLVVWLRNQVFLQKIVALLSSGLRSVKGGIVWLMNRIPKMHTDDKEDPLAAMVNEAGREAIFADPVWQQDLTVAAQIDMPQEVPLPVVEHDMQQEMAYVLPDPKIFMHSREGSAREATREHEARAKVLEHKLQRFGIEGKVTGMAIGPVVTLYEYAPEVDAKISRILALEDDLALALQAVGLRIIAPVPGKSVVGFEVANIKRATVFFGDICTRVQEMINPARVPIVIGADAVGNPIVEHIVDMPHILIAGSTGSGKSVAVHAAIASILTWCEPDVCRLLLIDPKQLEFAAYRSLPHLLFPVITDTQRAVAALSWAVLEMNRRYETLAREGVRTIAEFHSKRGSDAMPYIVIVIDELADLMLTVGSQVEESLTRLAQMARAAGIHLIVATQRPSVDVITGLVKVNFPSRIACKVISKIDSRTILDTSGAEKLLGKGDMLYLDAQGSVRRVQGAYLSHQDMQAVIQHCVAQREPMFEELDMRPAAVAAEENDPLYEEVVAFTRQHDEISISLLQRQFRIGYNRSARIMSMLESRGVVAACITGKMRKVIPPVS